MKIDVFVVYNDTVIEYVNYMKKSLEIFKSGNNKINWKCYVAGAQSSIPKGFKYYGRINDLNHNSMSHALAVNELYKYVTEDIAIYIDADVVLLCPSWDEVVIDQLGRHDCFGFGFGNNGSRYRNFPGIFMFAFNQKILSKVKLDWRPKLKEGKDSPCKYSLKDTEEAKYMGCKVGDVVKCDTGWQVPNVMGKAGLTGYALPRVLGKDVNHLLPFRDKQQKKFCSKAWEHMCEWHYNKKLFGTHQQACRSNHLYESQAGKIWRDRINLYTRDKFGVII